MLQVYDLTTEHLRNPVGVDSQKPRLSWKLTSDRKNVVQKSYRILAYDDAAGEQPIWDTGTVESGQSRIIAWDGPELKSSRAYSWKVMISDGTETAESDTASFEMGLLDASDWKAMWIEPETEVDPEAAKPAPLLRKEFTVKEGLVRARIYQSAHGLYEFWINGEAGTLDKFKPGLTNYDDRIQYQIYDITSLLQKGANCWAAALGDGWWRGTTGGTHHNNFGYKLAYLGQIRLDYADGSTEYVITDPSFKTLTGGLIASDMKTGDVYDARLEPKGWKLPGYDDKAWKAVHPEADAHAVTETLIPSRSVPVREIETFHPEILKTPNGETVLHFHQNIAGYVRMHLHGMQAGQTIRLVHGETLDPEGNFTQKNLYLNDSAPMQEVTYISDGTADEEYVPLFSVFGFQYVLIEGYEVTDPDDFTAVAVYSALEETGDFSCSSPLINQLVRNSRWSQKGNFLDVPTDCPTRERSPWSGDSQVYVRTSTDFMNVYPFFEKWMLDLNSEQFADGKVPNTFPQTNGLHNEQEYERMREKIAQMPDGQEKTFLMSSVGHPSVGNPIDGSSGWGDTAVITPYVLYLCYGDCRILENQYASAKKWVDFMAAEAEKSNPIYADLPYYQHPEDAKLVWDTGFHWGEWLEAGADAEFTDPVETFTHPDYRSATTYLFYSSHLVAEIAKILGEPADAAYYEQLSQNVKMVYNRYFIANDGTIKPKKQALNARCLMFDLADEAHHDAVAKKLNQMIVDAGYHLNTGFLSTPYLLVVLADNGYVDTAYRVLEQTTSPSWLYNVLCGATTILETWDGFEKCSGSFNHYSYGAVCDFLFSRTAGIRPDIEHPGYQHFDLEPVMGGTLTHAEATYESGYGTIRSAWKKDGDQVSYAFTIPANTTATVKLPYTEALQKKLDKQFSNVQVQEGKLVFTTGSGNYTL